MVLGPQRKRSRKRGKRRKDREERGGEGKAKGEGEKRAATKDGKEEVKQTHPSYLRPHTKCKTKPSGERSQKKTFGNKFGKRLRYVTQSSP